MARIPSASSSYARSIAVFASPAAAHQRRVALAVGSIMLASSICSAFGLATARAAESENDRRSKQYKIGAAVLGAGAAYYILKGKKVVPAIAAGAGAYYAYKKSQEYKQRAENDRYGNGYGDPNYTGGDQYPDDAYGDQLADYGDYANLPDDDYGYSNGPYAGGYGNRYPDYASSLRARRSASATKGIVANRSARQQAPKQQRAISVK